jgi:signal transduction histidine kinase
MKRLGLAGRVVLSHVAVVLVAIAVALLVVRQLAPALFDQSMRGTGSGGVPGAGMGMSLRAQMSDAVDSALVVGALVGGGVAALTGVWLAARLLRPLARVREATRRLASGAYDVTVERPDEPELAGLADDVNRLGSVLAQTESRRVQLMGDVAHEMRTPLTVIDGYVDGMTDGVLPADQASLAQIAGEVARLRRLADDLGTLSRAEEGRLGVVLAPIDVGELVATAAGRLVPQAAERGVRLVVDLPACVVVAQGDADRLAQVVTNLVSNAILASQPGGRIEVRVRSGGGRATVTVTDGGVGLDPGELERVFERFYRGAGRRPDRGTGVGLTIARGIMRAHGGDVTAASAGAGTGATFTAWLPHGASG